MQQPASMIPVMPSYPPTNITTEQIQKVPLFFSATFHTWGLLCLKLFLISALLLDLFFAIFGIRTVF